MPPAGWCTPEQNAWFAEHLANFHQARLDGSVAKFLAAMVVEFMERWPLPECREMIDGNSLEDIAKRAAQNAHYQKRKNQIETKFNNNRSKARIAAMNTATSKSLATSPKKKIIYSLKPLRRLRAIQIYSQQYYKTRKLVLINKITHETFKSEGEEIKAEVFNTLEQLCEERAEATQRGERSPEDYLDAIDAAPALLNRFLHDLALQTGWWFTVIAGGPDPADGGNIRTGSFHVGVNMHKKHFEDEYTHHSVDSKDSGARRVSFEEGVIAPYGRFLKTLFPPEIRAQRACDQADLQALKETLDSEGRETTPELSNLLSMSSPSSPSSPAPLFQPQSPCSAQPFLDPGLISGITSTQTPVPFNVDDNGSILTSAPTTSGGELGGHEFDLQSFWQDAMFGGDFFSMGATVRDRLAYDGLLGRATFEDEADSFPLASGATFGDYNEVHPEPTISGERCDLYLQPDSERSELPLLPSFDCDQTGEDENNTQLLSGVPRSSTTIDVDDEITPVPPVSIVNSKRQKRRQEMANSDKQLQEEGETAIADEDGGEDHERRTSMHARKPPASRGVSAVGWLPSAVQYLTDTNLGLEWAHLVAAWQTLEGQISQNSSAAKIWLGAITSRPASLTTWLQNRRYNVYPQLPASFSADFLTWWNALQPDWQRSDTGPLPAPNYSRPLDKALWKGGQNGLVTVLIGLMWWGQGVLSAEERMLWNATVTDIHACIRAMLPSLTETA